MVNRNLLFELARLQLREVSDQRGRVRGARRPGATVEPAPPASRAPCPGARS